MPSTEQSYAPIPTDPSATYPPSRNQIRRKSEPSWLSRFSPSRRSLRICLAIPFALVLALFAISIISYLAPSRSYLRPCLPFSLAKLSSSAHRTLSCSALDRNQGFDDMGENKVNGNAGSAVVVDGGSDMGRLGGFLQSQKDEFLQDMRNGGLKGWTVVMGNEAGDLDSLASSIAYSVLASTLQADRTIPLALTPSKHMSLRPENLLAFRMTSIPLTSLLHPEEFPTSVTLGSLASLGARFALVDHNKLLPQFGDASESVDAIIDHHDDEHAHLSAKVRIITVPTGSTTSLVTKHFQTQWQASLSSPAGAAGSPVPAELATLLLSGILIDTAGLKLGGKATAVDNDAAAFLYPLSPLSVGTNETLSSTALAGPGSKPKPLTDTYQALSQAKFDVSSLSTYQLLLRDYKEYNYPTSSTSYPSLRIGLSTVPLGLKAWLKEKEAKAGWNGLLEGVDGYMAERQLDLEGILTSYQSDKGKHKREIAIIARKGFAIKTNQEAKDVLMGVIAGLEASGQLLDLSTWEKSKGALLKRIISPSHHGRAFVDDFMTNDGVGRYGKVWKQGNAKSTRKQVAPCLRDVVAKL